MFPSLLLPGLQLVCCLYLVGHIPQATLCSHFFSYNLFPYCLLFKYASAMARFLFELSVWSSLHTSYLWSFSYYFRMILAIFSHNPIADLQDNAHMYVWRHFSERIAPSLLVWQLVHRADALGGGDHWAVMVWLQALPSGPRIACTSPFCLFLTSPHLIQRSWQDDVFSNLLLPVTML